MQNMKVHLLPKTCYFCGIEAKKCTRHAKHESSSIAKNMLFLRDNEPKIGTENDLAPLALRRLRRLRRSLRELEKSLIELATNNE